MNELLFDFMDRFLMPVFVVLLIVGLVAFLVWLPFVIWDEFTAEKFSLKKADWACVSYRRVESTHYIKVGEVMVPQITTSDVCVNWVRK